MLLLFSCRCCGNITFSRNSPSSSNRKPSNLQLYTKYISQFLFALHPVHVEAVANVANRPHILALLLNTTIVDPNIPLVAVAVLATLGLLTAETAIFQLPAIVLTMTAIRYRELLATEKSMDLTVFQRFNHTRTIGYCFQWHSCFSLKG